MAGNSRVLIGQLGGAFAAKVSKPGYNVDTATADQLLFDPSVINMRLYLQGESSSAGTINFGATLAKVPIVLVRPKVVSGQLCDGALYEYFGASVFLTVTTSSFTASYSSKPFAYFVFINEAYT